MNVKVRYEDEVGAEDILREASEIWNKCRKAFPPDNDPEEEKILEDLHHKMQNTHSKFAKAYPIVLRYMCEAKSYNKRALERYLRYLSVTKTDTDENSYFASQATYVKLLFACNNPRADKRKLEQIYTDTIRILRAEREKFKSMTENLAGQVKQTHENMVRLQALELSEWYAVHGMAAVDVPLSCVTCNEDGEDVPIGDIAPVMCPDAPADIEFDGF